MNGSGAYDCTRSVALSSSAGSGKTFALTTRLVALLLGGAHPSEILAITFTNAAAGDVRRKLFSRVEALAGGEGLSLFSEILGEDPSRVREKARGLIKSLVRQYSLLQISTIHSFFCRILRSFPRETSFYGDLAILDEWTRERYLSDALEGAFRSISRDGELFERTVRFIQSYRERGYRANRVAREAYDKVQARAHLLERTLAMIARGGDRWGEFEARLSSLRSGSLDGVFGRLGAFAEAFLASRGPSREVESFLRSLRAFGERRSVRDLAGIQALKRDLRYIRRIEESLREDDARLFRETLESARAQVFALLETRMRAFAQVYADIYGRIDRFYAERKESSNAVDFADIELRAGSFTARVEDQDYFSHRFGSRVRHVLIDEFQDTSVSQWTALEPVVRAAVARGGTLFYVGDVKQAIYRWRGGEPGLFDAVASRFPVEREALRYTYRQNEVLLEFVNGLFREMGRAHGYAYTPQELPDGISRARRGYVSVRRFEDREELLESLAALVGELESGGVSPGHCAVLCRTNGELEEVEGAFKESMVPFVSPGKRRLLGDYAALDAINILRWSLRPDEPIYAAGFLRSRVPRSGYTEVASLLESCRGRDGYLEPDAIERVSAPLFAFMKSALATTRWLGPARALRVIYEELDLLGVYVERRDALLELYDRAWEFERASRGAGISDFLEYLEEGSDDLTIKTGGEGGVKLLTVHASKGLEFHTVILPFIDKPFRLTLDGSILVDESREEGGGRFCIARADYRDHLSRDEGYARLFEEAERRERTDELNALYVAVTRAKENLLMLPLIKGKSKTVGAVLLDACGVLAGPGLNGGKEGREPALELGGLVSSGRAEACSLSPQRIFRRELLDAVSKGRSDRPSAGEGGPSPEVRTAGVPTARSKKDAARDAALPGSKSRPTATPREGRKERLKGIVVHRVLERIEELDGPHDREPPWLGRMLTEALSYTADRFSRSERNGALSAARRSLLNVLADRRIARYFSRGALREANVLSRGFGGGIGRVDRALIDEGVEVIDFKTNEVGDERRLGELVELYRAQIVSYCEALSELYPGRSVRGDLYFTDAPGDARIVTVFEKREE